MKKLLLLALLLGLAPLAHSQQTTVTATVNDPTGAPYAFGTGSGSLVCPGNQQPSFHGFTVPRTIPISGLDGNGAFSQKFYDINAIDQTGCGYKFSITDQTTTTSFTTGLIFTVTGTSVDLSATISAAAVPLLNLRTAGAKFLSVNTTPVTVNANTASAQTMQQAQAVIGIGTLNAPNKTIRVTSSGNFTPVNTTESVQIFFTPCGACTNSAFLPAFVPSTTSQYGWSFVLTCTVTATGATGTIVCAGSLNIGGVVAAQNNVPANTAGVLTYNNVNLTGSLTPNNSISFTTASASNSGTSSYFLVEQVN